MSPLAKILIVGGILATLTGCPFGCPEIAESVNAGVSAQTLEAAGLSGSSPFTDEDCAAVCERVIASRLAGTVTDVTSCSLDLVAPGDSEDEAASSAHLVCTADRRPPCR